MKRVISLHFLRSRSVIDSRLIDLTSSVAQSGRERRIRDLGKPKIHWRWVYDEEKNILSDIKRDQSINAYDSVRLAKSGELIEVSISFSPIYDREHNIVGMSALIRDNRKRKERERQLELLTEKLVQSNTELERFGYIASHDLQEPIRMITSFTEIIQQDYHHKFDEEGKEYLNIIFSSGVRMREIIDDLLAYSRLSNTDHRQSVFDGNETVRSVQNNLRSLIDEQHVVLIIEDMPTLYGNPVQILRVIQNLVINSIKYRSSDRLPEIHIRKEEKEDACWIVVEDNGIGIKPEFIDAIFLPFKRLHSWSQIPGSGLGLRATAS